MLAKIFQAMSLVGSEFVLYLLVGLSVLSISIIIERWMFYRQMQRDQSSFRQKVRQAVESGNFTEALSSAKSRLQRLGGQTNRDFDASVSVAVLNHGAQKGTGCSSVEVLSELAQDSILQARLKWEKNLAILATIGSNAPFIGLFGTVLGIIQAFHDLSQKTSGAQTVTAGISEALVATAVGILVAIPAVVAFNLFQRKVKAAVTEADALKCFLVAKLSSQNGK